MTASLNYSGTGESLIKLRGTEHAQRHLVPGQSLSIESTSGENESVTTRRELHQRRLDHADQRRSAGNSNARSRSPGHDHQQRHDHHGSGRTEAAARSPAASPTPARLHINPSTARQCGRHDADSTKARSTSPTASRWPSQQRRDDRQRQRRRHRRHRHGRHRPEPAAAHSTGRRHDQRHAAGDRRRHHAQLHRRRGKLDQAPRREHVEGDNRLRAVAVDREHQRRERQRHGQPELHQRRLRDADQRRRLGQQRDAGGARSPTAARSRPNPRTAAARTLTGSLKNTGTLQINTNTESNGSR